MKSDSIGPRILKTNHEDVRPKPVLSDCSERQAQKLPSGPASHKKEGVGPMIYANRSWNLRWFALSTCITQ